MNFWKNKVVLITGSRMGIGKEMAKQLGELDAQVMLNARNPKALKETEKELKDLGHQVSSFAADISNPNECNALIDATINEFGRLDALINNAGLASQTDIEKIDPKVFKSIVDVNLNGAVFMTQAALPALKESKGSLLFCGSVAGVQGIGGYSVYSASKMALKAVTQSLRIELAKDHIHVALAYIGFTQNDPNKKFLDASGKSVSLPNRSNVKQMPVELVAKKLLNMMQEKQKQRVFGTMGKLTYHLNRFAPFIISKVLMNAYWKEKKLKKER
jgi:short-subunit dehydrogenase